MWGGGGHRAVLPAQEAEVLVMARLCTLHHDGLESLPVQSPDVRLGHSWRRMNHSFYLLTISVAYIFYYYLFSWNADTAFQLYVILRTKTLLFRRNFAPLLLPHSTSQKLRSNIKTFSSVGNRWLLLFSFITFIIPEIHPIIHIFKSHF